MMVEDNEPEQVKRVPELIALSYFHFSLSNTPARVETKTHTHPSGCRRTNLSSIAAYRNGTLSHKATN